MTIFSLFDSYRELCPLFARIGKPLPLSRVERAGRRTVGDGTGGTDHDDSGFLSLDAHVDKIAQPAGV
jgi:hypothetical protein